MLNIVSAAAYAAAALTLGVFSGLGRARRRLLWLREGRRPTAAERRRTIGIPFAVSRVTVVLWAVAAVVFGVTNGLVSVLLGVEVVLTTAIGGLVSAATVYLLVERVTRPVVALALVDAPLQQQRGTGVAWRTIMSWAVGTALPVAGLVLLNGLAIGSDVSRTRLALATLVLGLIAIVFGLVIIIAAARSIAHPLKGLRRAMQTLAAGETGVQVDVTDAGEVGILQTGFNQMSAGLAERDRIRDLFGRHVGEDVARQALDEGVELGGEVRDVAVVFVDVTGSTALAQSVDPTTVVNRLNHLFGIVLEVVERNGGTVTTFAGDAVVCAWGAPLRHAHARAAALTAARELAGRLDADEDALPVGIGAAAGAAVAGNIGSAHRIEYTLIGDPVNCAARLSDLAKQRSLTVLVAGDMVAAAGEEESGRWQSSGQATLRGRTGATDLAVPTLDHR
ncbi:MAG: adenylate/guanylate cyclase domain-containing protein [Euzebya sp.]